MSRTTLGKLTPKIAFKVFDCQILPILEYGCEVLYTGRDIQQFEVIHLKYIKHALGLRTQTPTLAVYGDTGRFPLLVRQQIVILKYWNRLLSLSADNPIKHAYVMLMELDALGFDNWCTRIRQLLDSLNLSHLWQQQCMSSISILDAKEKIVQNFITKWKCNINDSIISPKLRSYKLFKYSFCVEPYLLVLNDNNLIRSMARLRQSSHDLEIERGRYNKPKTPAFQRICKRCNSLEVDDEVHFLIDCSSAETERRTLFSVCQMYIQNFFTNTSRNKFISIMSSREVAVVKALSIFVFHNFKKFK